MDNTTACIAELMFGCRWVNIWNNQLLELGRSLTFRIYVVFLWTFGTYIWIYGLESVFNYFLDNQELAFEIMDFVVVYVTLFCTFRDFTSSLWTYRSFYGNVLDSHWFLFEFVHLQEFMWYYFWHLGALHWVCGLTRAFMVMLWIVMDFHSSLWTCRTPCDMVLDI